MNELGITLILLGFAIFFISVFTAIKSKGKKKKRRSITTAIGLLLIAFGIYEFPVGAMELYKLTEELFSFNIWENYLFWLFISLSSIIIGVMLVRRRGR